MLERRANDAHSEDTVVFRGVQGHAPLEKIEIWGPNTAGNVLKWSILSSPRYFV